MTTETDNARRWDGATPGRYEVWYLTWNDPRTGQGFWLRYIIEAPVVGAPRAELWFARFDPASPARTFGVHRRFAIGELAATAAPFSLAIAGSELRHDGARGQLVGDGHDVRWDLRWQPAARALRLLPDVLYGGAGGGRAETTVVSPNPRVLASGTLVVDGERLAIDGAVLGQTHLWGKRHAYAWTWCRCAELDAAGSMVELLGVRLLRRGVVLPAMVVAVLELDGEQHRMNQFRHVALNRGTWGGQRVAFTARSATLKLDGELSCRPDDMVSAPYLDPDGTRVYCANTEIGDARLTVWRRAGLRWREHRTLVATRRAHFEIGGRARDRAVAREHVGVD